MELYTDTYYIQRIQAGDTTCFACLLDKYSRPVHSLILQVVRNREAALAQLPPDERAIILLFYMKEKTIDEVATITGLTAANIKVKLHRIRKKLFVVLKGMEEQ